MASKYAKKYPAYNKCCVIGTDEQREKALRLFPVGDVWGIGRRIARTLEYFGIRTAYDFAQRPKDWVRKKFHVTGERTWAELRGESVIDVDGLDAVEKKSIVTSRSFPGMLTDIEDVRSHVANYAARCALKLRRQGSVCSLVTVFIQSNHFREDLEQYDSSASYSFMTATNTTNEIVDVAIRMLDRIFRKGIHYKRAGTMVSGISPACALQPDLFSYNPERRKKYQDISVAIDTINRRIGADTVVLSSQQYRERGDDGKSIKFVNAIRRAMKSPDYTTRLGAFVVGLSLLICCRKDDVGRLVLVVEQDEAIGVRFIEEIEYGGILEVWTQLPHSGVIVVRGAALSIAPSFVFLACALVAVYDQQSKCAISAVNLVSD